MNCQRFHWAVLAGMCLASAGAASAQVDIRLIPRPAAGASDLAATLPAAQVGFPVGSAFVVEVWAQTTDPNGFAQVSLDATFNPALVSVGVMTQSAQFSLFPSGTVNALLGTIDNLSGAHPPAIPACADSVGAAPGWARVAIINMTADALGSFIMVSKDAEDLIFVIANCGSAVPPVTVYSAAMISVTQCGNSIVEPGEQCDDGNTLAGDCCSPTCQFESTATVCRAAAGDCDTAEFCDGAGTCAADAFLPLGTACGNVAATTCNNPDTCDGSGVCLSNFEPGTTQCRASAGACDVAETCDGAGACPVNVFQPSGTSCGDVTMSICDNPDTCDGGGVCQANSQPTTTICRAAASACDVAESCNGAGACPADAFQLPGTACGDPTVTVCDQADTCDGAGFCQQNPEPATLVCRAQVGACDTAEFCDGAGQCPLDVVKPVGVCRSAVGSCDVAESCDGLTKNCPADAFVAAGAACGDPASTTCDNPDTCNGAGTCLVNFAPVTSTCRPAIGDCDVTEFCDGLGRCPNDLFIAANTACGDPTNSVCDNPDTCDGIGTCLPNSEPGTTQCRPAASVCDVAESCDGMGSCPIDGFTLPGVACGDPTITVCDRADTCDGSGGCLANPEPVTTECRAAAGVCDVADFCDGLGMCSGDAKATTECRAAADACDVAEVCDGIGNNCPANAFSLAGVACGDPTISVCDNADTCDGGGACLSNPEPTITACRLSAGACDLTDFCNGVGMCSTDAKSTLECRAAVDACDVAEVCDGIGNDCPANAFSLAGAACGDPTATTCNNADTCDGGGVCLSNFEPIATECRAAAGVCDVADFCDGLGMCSGDAKATTECRAAVDVCDVAEVCDGVGNDCPVNAFSSAGVACGDPTTSVCDNADTCDGSGACLNNPQPSSTVCRASTGACDLTEFCDGVGMCAADAKSTLECRAAVDACDVAEVCDGIDNNCPADSFAVAGSVCGDVTVTACDNADSCDGLGSCLANNVADGTSCSDAVFCNGDEACLAGVCEIGPAVCTDACETCSEAAGACKWCIFDHNLNSVMDGFDFSLFSGCFGACFLPGDACLVANYDADPLGCVGGSDFGAFSGCFSQTCGECAECSGPPPAGSVSAATSLSATSASVQLVAVDRSQVDDVSAILPLSRSSAAHNESLDVEVWASLNNAGFVGLGSVYIDVAYDPSQLVVEEVIPSASFSTFSRGHVDSSAGLISAVGGCAPLGEGTLGAESMWVRVATLRMRATGAGMATMTVGPSYGPYGVSVFGRFGDLTQSQLDFGDVRLSLRAGRAPASKAVERVRARR